LSEVVLPVFNVNGLAAHSCALHTASGVELNFLPSPFIESMLARRFIFRRRASILLPKRSIAHAKLLSTLAAQEDNKVMDKA
jgi:hypothetical protein